MKISIIGVGRLGGALALALAEKGFEIENLSVRNEEKGKKVAAAINPKPRIITDEDFSEISSEVILIATQDDEITKVAEKLSKKLRNKSFIFHTSGALSSEILSKLKEIGCPVGSIHPLISVSDSFSGAKRFSGAYFCVEGDANAVKVGRKIAETLGGKSFSIRAEYKTLYHASAVTASGHLVALIDAAIEMLTSCGLEAETARKVLLPLIKSTIDNLSDQTPARALTGTFARADVETLDEHLNVLPENVSTETLELYLQLGIRSLHLAKEQGANAVRLEKMRGKISLAKKNLKC